MNDLTDFLNARLDEDEAYARNAFGYHNDAGPNWHEQWSGAVNIGDSADLIPTGDSQVSRFIARFDPARELREAEVKRAIIKRHVPVVAGYGPLEDQQCCAAESSDEDMWYAKSWPCSTILAIAAVWNDHPDYRDEWKP